MTQDDDMTTTHYDAIVIGAGGSYALKKLRDGMDLDVRLFDKAGSVGGTWHWHRYPGALSDTRPSPTATPATPSCCRNGTSRPATSTNPRSSATSST